MIPKKIHYFWVGGNSMSEKNKACIESFRKFCPNYDIIEWNESNYDITKCTYMKQAYEAGMWGFVPDYARLDILYREGGIYLDTDVELIRNLDDLLDCHAFMGFESRTNVALGLGFGAESGNEIIKKMRDQYDGLSFLNEDHTLNVLPSPAYTTEILSLYGLVKNGKRQTVQDIEIFPPEYFAPLCYANNRLKVTKNTYSIHWYQASWHTKEQSRKRMRVQKINRIFGQHLGGVVNFGIDGLYGVGRRMCNRGK